MTHADEMRQVAALEKLASMDLGSAFKEAVQELVMSLKESQSGGGEKAAEGVTRKVIMQGERNYYIDFAGKSGTVIIRRL